MEAVVKMSSIALHLIYESGSLYGLEIANSASQREFPVSSSALLRLKAHGTKGNYVVLSAGVADARPRAWRFT